MNTSTIYNRFLIAPSKPHIRNVTRSATTMVGPMGEAIKSDAVIPTNAWNKEMQAAQTVTCLNVLKMRIAERAGKITKADTKSAPKRFIATTTVTAVTMAISVL